jgi:hypothetical protein
MPRPVSWLPRLHEIARSVVNSVRSHYDRRDLEKLFELQPRAAQKLLEMLPTVQVGTSSLVEREALSIFLERVRESENTTDLFELIRKEKAQTSRRKIRALVRRNLDPIDLTALPASISLNPGRLELRFETTEELCEAMLTLARVLQDEPEEFRRRYEKLPPFSEQGSILVNEMDHLFEELDQLEREHAVKLH